MPLCVHHAHPHSPGACVSFGPCAVLVLLLVSCCVHSFIIMKSNFNMMDPLPHAHAARAVRDFAALSSGSSQLIQ